LDLKIDAQVRSSAGKKFGKLHGIVVDLDTRVVSDLVVRKGRLVPCDRIVPFEDIAGCGDDIVELEADADPRDCPTVDEVQLEPLIDQPAAEAPGDDPARKNLRAAIWYPLYGTVAYVRPVRRVVRCNLPERSEELQASSPITSADREVGRVAGIIASNSGAITHLLAVGKVRPEVQQIPIGSVEDISEDGVVLRDRVD
jgi:sporulation protein YlmC with PRC-barrel domain